MAGSRRSSSTLWKRGNRGSTTPIARVGGVVRDHDTGSVKAGSLGEGVHGRCFAETVHGSRPLACGIWFVPLPTRRFTLQSVKSGRVTRQERLGAHIRFVTVILRGRFGSNPTFARQSEVLRPVLFHGNLAVRQGWLRAVQLRLCCTPSRACLFWKSLLRRRAILLDKPPIRSTNSKYAVNLLVRSQRNHPPCPQPKQLQAHLVDRGPIHPRAGRRSTSLHDPGLKRSVGHSSDVR